MGHDWVIHVLTDLRRYAQTNEMPLLGEQLDEAMIIAAVEIASQRRRPTNWPVEAPNPQGNPRNE